MMWEWEIILKAAVIADLVWIMGLVLWALTIITIDFIKKKTSQ